MHLSRVANVTIWKCLNDIQIAIQADDERMAELMDVRVREFRRQRTQRVGISARSACTMSKRLGVSFEALLCGTIDMDALAARARGQMDVLPGRYQVGAFSRRRTSSHIIKYLERHGMEDVRDRVLCEIQVNRAAFDKNDDPANALLASDVCAYLSKNGFSNNAMLHIGAYSTDVNKGGPISNFLKACTSSRETYEVFAAELVSMFDENFDYRILEISDSELMLRITEKPKVQEALGMRGFANIPTCFMRMGVIASFPRYKGLPAARCRKVSCIYDGDSSCRYSFSYSN